MPGHVIKTGGVCIWASMGCVVIELSLQGFVGTLFQGVPFVVVVAVAIVIVGRLGITYGSIYLVGGRARWKLYLGSMYSFFCGPHVLFGVRIVGRYGCNSYSGVGGFAFPR